MKVAPFRALTHAYKYCRISACSSRGNGGRPFQGIDTDGLTTILNRPFHVEMEVAPFRALTHGFHVKIILFIRRGGNEGRPFQGIDTAEIHTVL